MRTLALLFALMALATQALAQNAPEATGVTILRGNSTPPAPPATPSVTVVYRDTVYAPVYVGQPAYVVGVPLHAFGPALIAAPALQFGRSPNGRPLIGAGRR